ncbi:MAG TPA: hypothetical protein RMF84_08250, partial [Polyangiaceae bacterium LLY-WYZ-14_1]|nr:hypothetical protein [Polyangiaceae bacterium LLY-WYZ-14_1]
PPRRRGSRRAGWGWARATAVLIVGLLGCEEPGRDSFRSAGGAAFDPAGVIRGSIQYVGPAPACDQSGEVSGRVVMTLFRFDDPPAPEGTATSPVNLLVVPGDELFGAGDCAGEEDQRVLVRSTGFVWPNVPLGDRYQIRAFYDREGDFVPFFSETNQPTAGDLVGGGFGLDGTFQPVTFDPAEDRPRGQEVEGVTVTLSAPQRTERPLFELEAGWRPLDASRALPLNPNTLDDELFAATRTALRLLDPAEERVDQALAALGIELDGDEPFYAWFLRPLDLDRDGEGDLHPTLGAGGVPWVTPIIQLRRIPLPGEPATPPVSLFGTPRLRYLAANRSVLSPSLEFIVAPIAVVDTLPGDPACQIPYLAPGNVWEAYHDGPRVCQELPTGRYAITAVQGLAGGTVDDSPPFGSSDIGLDLVDARFSSQTWTVPNALGRGPTSPPPSNARQPEWTPLPGQGLPGTFLVSDSTPDDGVGLDDGRCDQAPRVSQGLAFAPLSLEAPAERCCEAVAHLCALPVCPAGPVPLGGEGDGEQGGDEAFLRTGPDCLPFAMPAGCCGEAS